ncbi:MAG: hypothetical protein JWO45_1300 [Spartobacteria bacterium]|nr:hypothetical protein [Spartobacteria bacterium]
MEIISNSGNSTRNGLLAAAFCLAAVLAPSAHAVPTYYELASGSVTANTSEPGLVIGTSVNPSVPGTSFTLNDGGSTTFSFFDIWTDEPTINSDDKVSFGISATLNFVDPFTGATVNGITVGGSLFKGLSQWGELTWNGPVTVTVPGDRVFQITLSDETFNYGFGGLNEGMMCGATVEATITQIGSTVPPALERNVADSGSTVVLLGVAVAGLGLLARKRTVV